MSKLDLVIRISPDGLGSVMATHAPPMRRGQGSNPDGDDRYALLMSSTASETRVWCFLSARLTGGPEICAFRMESEGQSVNEKNNEK